jgi:hypothetical protein
MSILLPLFPALWTLFLLTSPLMVLNCKNLTCIGKSIPKLKYFQNIVWFHGGILELWLKNGTHLLFFGIDSDNPRRKGWHTWAKLVKILPPFPPNQCWSVSSLQQPRECPQHWLVGEGEGMDQRERLRYLLKVDLDL